MNWDLKGGILKVTLGSICSRRHEYQIQTPVGWKINVTWRIQFNSKNIENRKKQNLIKVIWNISGGWFDLAITEKLRLDKKCKQSKGLSLGETFKESSKKWKYHQPKLLIRSMCWRYSTEGEKWKEIRSKSQWGGKEFGNKTGPYKLLLGLWFLLWGNE